MQAREDTLALLTGSPEKTTESAMEHLLSMYGAQENLDPVREKCDKTQRKTILDELSEILHLRGRLQQMGATFAINGELLTYGNPHSPSEFQAMLRLGPMYEEQWNTFFVENYVLPDYGDADCQLWSDLRTLKRVLQNEGLVFSREHQRCSFGDSSTKLRRLCCAYDELRIEWLTMMRSSLPALDDTQLSTLLGGSSSEEGSESGEDGTDSKDGTVILDNHHTSDCTGWRPRKGHYRSSGVPQAVGWRFSDDSTSPPRKNGQWRFSDNLESVPMWEDVECANAESAPVTPQLESMSGNHDSQGASDTQGIARAVAPPPFVPKFPVLHGSSPLQVSRAASLTARSYLLTLLQNMNTQSMIFQAESRPTSRRQPVPNNGVSSIWARETSKNDGKSKKWGKVRRWFRHVFGCK
jgi:hypothetical protein